MNHRSNLAGRTGLLFLSLLISQLDCRLSQAGGVSFYRCNVDGMIEFRQTACERGEESMTHVTDSSRGMTPSEPGLRLKKPSEKSDKTARTESKPADEARCWKKRQQLERVEQRLRSGYRPSQSQRLHDRQDEYEAYLRRFCR